MKKRGQTTTIVASILIGFIALFLILNNFTSINLSQLAPKPLQKAGGEVGGGIVEACTEGFLNTEQCGESGFLEGEYRYRDCLYPGQTDCECVTEWRKIKYEVSDGDAFDLGENECEESSDEFRDALVNLIEQYNQHYVYFSTSEGYTSDEVYFDGEIYTVELISASDFSANIRVTDAQGSSESKIIEINEMKVILGLQVKLNYVEENIEENIFFASLIVSQNSIVFGENQRIYYNDYFAITINDRPIIFRLDETDTSVKIRNILTDEVITIEINNNLGQFEIDGEIIYLIYSGIDNIPENERYVRLTWGEGANHGYGGEEFSWFETSCLGKIPMEWAWLLRNLNSNTITEISSPSDISGPILGIASNSDAQGLNSNILSDRESYDIREEWVLPNSYLSLRYNGLYPQSEGPTNYLDVKFKKEEMNLLNALNVGEGWEEYLLDNAKVISVTSYSPLLDENMPSLMLNYQLNHLRVGTWIWIDDNYNDYTNYFIEIREINPDGSLLLHLTKRVCSEGWQNCNYIFEQERPLYRGDEYTYHGTTIYNFDSGYYTNPEDENNWVILYRYNQGSSRTNVEPSSNIMLFPFVDNEDNETKLMTFYVDSNGNLIFKEVFAWPYDRPTIPGYINYYSGYSDIITYEKIENSNTLGFGLKRWYRGENGEDNLLSLFKFENGELVSLGDLQNQAEAEELIHFYGWSYYEDGEPNPIELSEIGEKDFDLLSSSGIIVRNPSINSLDDSTSFSIQSGYSYARYYLKNIHAYSGHSDRSTIGDNIFKFPQEDYELSWLYDYTTQSYPTSRQNPLLLLKTHANYENNYIGTHESLVLGSKTPSTESSITSRRDEYGDKAYTETLKAYDPSGYLPNQGIKYIYSLDEPLDFSSITENNPLDLMLVDKNIRIINAEDNSIEFYESCSDCSDEWFCIDGNVRAKRGANCHIDEVDDCRWYDGGGYCDDSDGPGPEDAFCVLQYYAACEGQSCVEVQGIGEDECVTNNDCYCEGIYYCGDYPDEGACETDQCDEGAIISCTWNEGSCIDYCNDIVIFCSDYNEENLETYPGYPDEIDNVPDLCNSNPCQTGTCGWDGNECIQYHSVCNEQEQCVQVPGQGASLCGTDDDCIIFPDGSHAACPSPEGFCIVVPGPGEDGCSLGDPCGQTECIDQQCVLVPWTNGGVDCTVGENCGFEG